MRAPLIGVGLLVLVASTAPGCASTVYQAKFTPPDHAADVDHVADFLKCHMADGAVYVLRKWRIEDDVVFGSGILYDSARTPVFTDERELKIPLANVVLLETNRPQSIARSHFAALAIVTGVSLVMTAMCLTNPKACFGSCPTFFAFDGERESLQAEGFSASVARVLESTDVDAMWTARPRSSVFDVRMTNDALETHMVDRVRVIAVPRPNGARVLRAGDAYYPALRMAAPTSCVSASGDCLADVVRADSREYASLAGERDLAEKETIELDLPASSGARGLLVGARNTLLNTFLFYQGLAYMGRSAGEWFAKLEQSGARGADGFRAIAGLLGDVEVAVAGPDGEWIPAGAFAEVGPIAREVQLVKFPPGIPDGPARVRLTLTKGNFKLDQIALVELGAAIDPVFLDPVAVTRDAKPAPDALARLLDPAAHLVTFPGDAYVLRFQLPPGDHELFLESRGYYYEWIREEWLAEESATELLRLIADPAGSMRRLAPKYKRIEGDMERIFWKSRFGARP